MIKRYDSVVLTETVPPGLQQGDVGTVVMVHEGGKGYEVEFFTLVGNTFSVETLLSHQVRPVAHNEILHVRKIA